MRWFRRHTVSWSVTLSATRNDGGGGNLTAEQNIADQLREVVADAEAQGYTVTGSFFGSSAGTISLTGVPAAAAPPAASPIPNAAAGGPADQPAGPPANDGGAVRALPAIAPDPEPAPAPQE